MKEQPVEKRDILQLIPQRPPFVMVDRLHSVQESEATSVYLVTSDSLFVREGLFRESGLIENIAQTAAAMNGYHAMTGGVDVKNGYIGGIKNLEINFLPAVGDQITTRVVEEHRVMGASIVVGEAMAGGRVAATCEMKVFME